MKKIIALILIIGIIFTYIFAFNMRKADLVEHDLRAYDPNNFTDSNELINTNRLVASNDDFELYIDETTSYFKVVDLRNGEVYLSNPNIEDPWVANPEKQSLIQRLKNKNQH